MRTYSVELANHSGPCIHKEVNNALDEIRSLLEPDAQVGDKVTVEIGEMSEEEYAALPEFDGY